MKEEIILISFNRKGKKMHHYTNNERNTEQANSEEQLPNTKVDLINIGETIDLKGGQVLNVPDFVELATQGFSEDELKDILRLRRRFEVGNDYEITPEHKRLSFAKWLYEHGKLDS